MSREPLIAVYVSANGRRAMIPDPFLTPREREVLSFLSVGMTNRQIAAELNIGTSTVKSHLSSIYEKLGVSNRTQAGLVGLGILPTSRALAS